MKWEESRAEHEQRAIQLAEKTSRCLKEEQEEALVTRGRQPVLVRSAVVGAPLARYLIPLLTSVILYLVISSLGGGGGGDGRRSPSFWAPASFQVQAFNLDGTSAVVHHGPGGSYFGYSVAQHRNRGVNYLLVGAPQAQTGQPGVERAGAVYKCAPSNALACKPLKVDPTGDSTIELQGERIVMDDKSHQWFGASLQSATESGFIVACAPAYVYLHAHSKVRRRDPVGNCWLSRGFDDDFLDYSPCRHNESWGHHRLGSCQAGFASAITKDGGRLFMAAPGSHVWQGQVFMHNLRSDLMNATSAMNPRDEDDSYLGYSLALGRFSSVASAPNAPSSDSDLAIGVPRGAQLAGKVMLVDRETRPLRNITGEQVGAYFGYALAVADLNGDGLDDLIIGAPNYYNQSRGVAQFDRGRVYVAFQDKRHEFAIGQRLDGQRDRARFGTALANCGDLNRDGVPDLAVGAPHDGPEARGAVHIFMGRRNGLLAAEPDQILYAESVGGSSHPFKAFGFALSAGLDMDGNQYPDLLVGDYAADRAVLVRARPVVTAATSISFQPEHFNLEERNCLLPNSSTSVSCITIQWCTKYTGLNVDNKLAFVYDLKLDTENNRTPPRLFLLNQPSKSEEQILSTLTKDVQQCRSTKAYVTSQIRDKLTPFKVDIDYSLAADNLAPTEATFESRLRPVLNKLAAAPGPANQMSKVAMIQRNCGPDNICVPDLRLSMQANLDAYTIGSNEKLALDVSVRNLGEEAFESMFFLTMPMDVNFITINKTARSDYPICYGTKADQTGENVLTCDLGNPQARNELVRFTVIAEPARTAPAGQADFTFAALVNSTNPEQDDRHREDNQVQLGIPIRVDFQLALSGNSQPPRWVHNSSQQQANAASLTRAARLSEADVGPEIYHTYQLQNRGPSTISDIALTILWPSKTRDSADHLLYLVDEPLTSDKVRCKPAPDDAINPLGLRYLRGSVAPISQSQPAATQAPSPPSQPPPPPAQQQTSGAMARGQPVTRYRRQQEPAEAQAEAQALSSTVDEAILQQLYLASCGPSHCTRFECNVYELASNEIATIKIRARLFEETLGKLSLQEFGITSKLIAQVKQLPHNVSTHNLPPYSYKVETQVLTTGLAVQDLLPWWLLVLSILLGILLFALLACFLKYLGFFARKRLKAPTKAEREPLTPTIWNDY